MLTSRTNLGVAVINDTIYAIGGNDKNEKYTPIDYIPEFPSWTIFPMLIVSTLAVIVIRNKIRRRENE